MKCLSTRPRARAGKDAPGVAHFVDGSRSGGGCHPARRVLFPVFWALILMMVSVTSLAIAKIPAPVSTGDGIDAVSWVVFDEAATLAELTTLDAAQGLRAEVIVSLPTVHGDSEAFRLELAPVMEESLARRFPEIRAYRGVSTARPDVFVRVERFGTSVSAMVFDPDGSWMLVPEDGRHRLVTRVASPDHARLACSAGDFEAAMRGSPHSVNPAPDVDRRAVGDTLRVYRFAVAAAGEFTQHWGGTVAAGLAGVVQAVNRLNQIYENEVGVRLILVPNNDQLIFVDPLTDPFTNGNIGAMVLQVRNTIESIVGSSGYDVGHLLATAGGGGAGTGVVCGPNKAAGVSADPDPSGDPFWVDYVAHELGHQFGSKHTFNGCDGFNSRRDADSAFEPGSGSTIMAFAGLCGTQNLQPFSSPYFHVRSLEQMHGFTQQGLGSTCGTSVATGNNAPTVSAAAPRTIPARTPFRLVASATDPDGDPLSYTIEQFDLGPATANGTEMAIDTGTGPLLRSFPPASSPVRVFPRLADLLAGTTSPGEALPTTTRTLTFRVTARDNRLGGGGVAWSGTTTPAVPPIVLNVVGTAGPFRVLSQATPISWTGASQQIEWDPSGTASAPISCADVSIRLSTDGGLTFPITLVGATSNDGVETVLAPSIDTTTARIEVACVDNVFFDVNDANITISGSQFVDPLFRDGFEQPLRRE